MKSGIGHIVCNATCDLCNHYWVAVIEVDFIDYGNKIEYKTPETLQCSNCMGQTSNYEVVIQNKEVQVPQQEISDEEIEKQSKYWNETINPEMWTFKLAWKAGSKWYREQLKQKK